LNEERIILHPSLLEDGGTRNFQNHPYCIKTEIRLSLALRLFWGACPYDLIVSHGVCYMSVFYSIWGVVDVVNRNPHLKIIFPDYQEQEKKPNGSSKCQVLTLIKLWGH
jgi:hypothetical protein